MRFDDCLSFVLIAEGGYSDRPHDHGGPTNHGITQAVYSIWREEHGAPDQDVRLITSHEVAAIYQEGYWFPAGAQNCPKPLDLLVFDCAVNSGPGVAVRTLQRALGINDDGVPGPCTRASLDACDAPTVASKFLAMRRAFFLNLVAHDETQNDFLAGWLNRVDALELASQNLTPTNHNQEPQNA
jgi:lysozyme family protein